MKEVAPITNVELAQIETTQIRIAQPVPKLVSRWEVVGGKLVCKWFNNPD